MLHFFGPNFFFLFFVFQNYPGKKIKKGTQYHELKRIVNCVNHYMPSKDKTK